MLIQQVQRDQAEKIFISIKNVDADSITTGMGVRFVGGNAAAEIVSTDGINCVKLLTYALQAQMAGISKGDIPSNGYGLVQAYGYCDSIAVSIITNTTIGVSGSAASQLYPGAVAGTFISTLPVGNTVLSLDITPRCQVTAWTTAGLSDGYCAGFVRAL